MFRFLLVAACVFADAGAAVAFEGRYVAGSKGYDQSLTIRKRDAGGFTVVAEVATRGCIGEVEAVGDASGDTLTASATEGGETCRLTLARTRRGLRLDEDHCIVFHGAACEFSGDYRKR